MTYQQVVDHVRSLNPEVTVVAVSKKRTVAEIEAVYAAGCRDFGENRVPEALEKMEQLPADIRWHFVGTLQRKKVPKVVGRFHLIHSVDSYELAEKIASAGEPTPVLLEVNTSGEHSKHGFAPDQLRERLPQLDVRGLMTMAPLTDDEAVIRACFSDLRHLRDELNSEWELSMGMSGDYPLAIEEGATLVRIGTAIFE